MMSQTRLVGRVWEIDLCKEQLTLMPTEWDYSLNIQERLAIEDVARRQLFLPIFVYKSEKGERVIFYGNNFYKSLKELCGKYDRVVAPIFEYSDPLDGVRQFVIWYRLVLRRNVRRSELRSLKNLLKLDLDEDQIREALGHLSAFVELPPPPRPEPEGPKEEPATRPTQPVTQPIAPPPLEEILKIKETVQMAEKLEKLGERGKEIIERLDEKKVEKLAPIVSVDDQKLDLLNELAKLSEDTLKKLIMLTSSQKFTNIVAHLNELYDELDKVEAILGALAKRSDIIEPLMELLRTSTGIKLLAELSRFKEVWADLAYWLGKHKSDDELLESLQ